MKKLLMIAAISGCVLATSVMADGVCPSPSDVKLVSIGSGKYAFEASEVIGGQYYSFQQMNVFEKNPNAVLGTFFIAATFAPGYNIDGPVACNYTNATLWLLLPPYAAADFNAPNNKWFKASTNANQCNSTDPQSCPFTPEIISK